MHTPKQIISGGQTGVDRGALQAARRLGIAIGGWCPPNREAEDGIIPLEFDLNESPYERSNTATHVPRSLRTEWNVRDSDATLILMPHTHLLDPGTKWTIDCCLAINKAYLICDPYEKESKQTIQKWLDEHKPLILNLAGPSESNLPGIQDAVKVLLQTVFSNKA
ncbi:putative molybdenum carrier protein [Marinifilum sp.]|uniref:putative molybdenum carrier protein n=1 Tax=Marinifilum sp. TaxID=2033137 RepID=UPI003BAD3884